MPYNGSGIFARIHTWANEAAAGTPITASEFDEQEQDFAAAFGNCITRDGQGGPTADIPWNNFGITGLRAPKLAGDAANKGYVDVATGARSMGGYQINNLASPAVGTDAVNLTYLQQYALNTALPSQTGNAGKFVTTDGTNASWALPIPTQTGNASKLLTTNGTISSWSSSLSANVIRFADGADATKLLAFDASGITTATTRTIAVPNKSGTMALTSDIVMSKPGMGAGRYYTYPLIASITTATTPAINTMYGVPVFISAANTFTKIGVSIQSAIGNVRLGIYNMDSAGLPSTLVVDAGTMALSSSGDKEIAINTALTAGWYYLAAIFDNSQVSIAKIASVSAGAFVYGGATASADVATPWAPQIAQTLGALPASFGAATFVNMTTAHPLIWVRI